MLKKRLLLPLISVLLFQACGPLRQDTQSFIPVRGSELEPYFVESWYGIEINIGDTFQREDRMFYEYLRHGGPYSIVIVVSYRDPASGPTIRELAGQVPEMVTLSVGYVGEEPVSLTGAPQRQRAFSISTSDPKSGSASLVLGLPDQIGFKADQELLVAVSLRLPDGQLHEQSIRFIARDSVFVCNALCQQ